MQQGEDSQEDVAKCKRLHLLDEACLGVVITRTFVIAPVHLGADNPSQ